MGLYKIKKEISFDTSSYKVSQLPSFSNSRHAPFLFFALVSDKIYLLKNDL
jgi:hypothetical protein